jgi:hypothetical protein
VRILFDQGTPVPLLNQPLPGLDRRLVRLQDWLSDGHQVLHFNPAR